MYWNTNPRRLQVYSREEMDVLCKYHSFKFNVANSIFKFTMQTLDFINLSKKSGERWLWKELSDGKIVVPSMVHAMYWYPCRAEI